ncbi:hypothetical protein AB0L57_09900 [Nocardia sp. NPDC052254]|uniref:hypothetical protein n=1 Tax=Nocardia sp. NPDC052254 TaxID=3155681 RepID=UPI0034203B7A
MTRELPYDDDADADDHAGDAAYRVATGVARVARAGAYVTGGALIASNGAPAPQNESHNTGWSTSDPHPDVPSPVVTYPDPSPDSVPPDLGVSAPAEPALGALSPGQLQLGTDAIPGFQWSFTEDGRMPAGESPAAPDGTGGAAPYWGTPGSGEIFPGSGTFMQDFDNGPGYSVPGLNPASAPAGTAAPDDHMPGRFGGSGTVDSSHADAMLPGHGLGLPGANGLHIPGMNGFGPGGFGSAGIEPGDGMSGAQPGDGHGAIFDGVGDGTGFGVWLGVDSTFDAHIGPDGVWLQVDSTVQLAVGDVGDQLDNFGQWFGAGSQHLPGAAGQATELPGQAGDSLGQPLAADAAAIGTAAAASGQSGATHAAGATVSPTAASGAAPTITPQVTSIASPGSVAPSFQAPQPAAPMVNVAAPQPVSPAPVAPAMPAPVAPPAPALAQPVAATPLQTTIQPEVATHPVANVFSAHAGPSPLTAPALAVPALFDDRPHSGGSGIRLPGHDDHDPSDWAGSGSGRTTTPSHTGTTSEPGTSHPSTTAGAGHTSSPSTSDHPSTLPGGRTGHPSTDHTTPTVTPPRDTDSETTTRPGGTTSESDSGPGHVTTPETTDSDPTTPGHTATHGPGIPTGTDTSATGDAGDSTVPTRTPQSPDQDWTSSQHSAPSTHSQPVPTHEPTLPSSAPTVPTPQHTVDPFPGDSGMPSHTAHVEPPTVNKPPTIDPAPTVHVPVKPAAHMTDSYDTSLWQDSGHGLTSVAAPGLDGGLHENPAQWHHSPVDPIAAVHPAFDSHISL